MTTTADSPPPVLDCARVLAYAVVDTSVRYVERKTLFVDGQLLGQVPRLAICQNIGENELMVFHCDNDWNVLGVAAGHDSIAKAKNQVERSYHGIDAKWIDNAVTVAEAEAYLREQFGDDGCSFCGRMFYQVTQFFSGSNGRICDICVRKFSGPIEKEHG
jgi:hypothetical protein